MVIERVRYEANGERINCMWKPIADFRNGARLYPDGLLALLDGRPG